MQERESDKHLQVLSDTQEHKGGSTEFYCKITVRQKYMVCQMLTRSLFHVNWSQAYLCQAKLKILYMRTIM